MWKRLWLLFPLTAMGQEWVTLGEMLGIGKPEERHLQRQVIQLLRETGGGAFTGWSGKLATLSLEEAWLKALEHNLTLKRLGGDWKVAQAALKEARAVFAPVFQLTAAYGREETYDRSFVGTVRLRNFQVSPGTGGVIDIPRDPNNPNPQITAIGFRNQTPSLRRKKIKASRGPEFGHPDERVTFSVSVEQELPWGGQIRLVDTLGYHPVYYHPKHFWEAPWSANLLAQLRLALPWSRNFGRYSPAATQVKLRRKERSVAFWRVKAQVNAILRDVGLAFWDLVGAYERLLFIRRTLEEARQQFERGERLWQLREITRADWLQLQQERQRLQVFLEQSKVAVIRASLQLDQLLAGESGEVGQSLHLPVGYLKRLRRLPKIEPREALTRAALQGHPALALARAGRALRDVELAFRRVQKRPDLTLNMEFRVLQDDSKYAYRNWGEALARTFDPDLFSQNYTLTYTYPWGNRAVKAAFAQALFLKGRAEFDIKDVENQIYRDIDDALSKLKRNQVRAQLAEARLKRSLEAYERLKRRSALGEPIEALALVEYLRFLLAARLDWLDAVITLQKAQIELFAAQGLLPNRLDRLATNPKWTQLRLMKMAKQAPENFFMPDGVRP